MMSIVLAHLATIIIYKNSGVVENMTTEDLVSEEKSSFSEAKATRD